MNESTLNILNSTLQSLIPPLQFVLVIFPFMNKKALFDERRITKPYLLRFSNKGYVFIAYGLILVIITITQNHIAKELNILQTKNIEANNSKRDSINQSKIELASLKTGEMLAKYGYKVDTKNEEIVKILRDPNSRKITIVNGENPVLDIYEIKIDKEINTKIYLTFISYAATSYDINIKLDLFAVANNKIYLVGENFPILPANTILTKDMQLINTWKLSRDPLPNTSMYYFKLYGFYKKYDGTIISIEKYCGYDLNGNQTLGYLIPSNERIKEMKNTH
jgi:hypothetical protein